MKIIIKMLRGWRVGPRPPPLNPPLAVQKMVGGDAKSKVAPVKKIPSSARKYIFMIFLVPDRPGAQRY